MLLCVLTLEDSWGKYRITIGYLYIYYKCIYIKTHYHWLIQIFYQV